MKILRNSSPQNQKNTYFSSCHFHVDSFGENIFLKNVILCNIMIMTQSLFRWWLLYMFYAFICFFRSWQRFSRLTFSCYNFLRATTCLANLLQLVLILIPPIFPAARKDETAMILLRWKFSEVMKTNEQALFLGTLVHKVKALHKVSEWQFTV